MSEALNQQIDLLEEIYRSESDPQGRAFVPLADAHRRLGDLTKAQAIIEQGLGKHPDFASAHMVAGWVHRSLRQPDDAMRSFERVLALDAENSVARAAIAELIDDERARTYRAKIAAKKAVEQSSVEIMEHDLPVVPIASLAPDGSDPRPVVPIASLAPAEWDESGAVPGAAPLAVPDAVPDRVDRPVVPIGSLAPGGGEDEASGAVPGGGEIYTETLAELYAGQGATEQAIEVYRKLIADDPDNEALGRRLTALESFEHGSAAAPADSDVQAELGDPSGGSDERRTVPIESLAPDGDVTTRFPI